MIWTKHTPNKYNNFEKKMKTSKGNVFSKSVAMIQVTYYLHPVF